MTWKIGHRGACGHAPENTLLSMRKALELGVHGFEFDIQMSKDGEPVVIHDDTLPRTTNGTGLVAAHTFKELQQFDAGKGEKIPSLRNVLDFVDKRCRLFIELKAEHATEAVADILKHYVANFGWTYEQLFVVSFDHTQLAAMRAINSDIRTGALIVGIPVSLAAIAVEAGAWSINPGVHHTTKALVDDAHKRGLKVLTWTANQPEHIAKAKSLGVDGIFSDFPERL
jgi:glycerophosphoryl diester phosphodiesterase